MYHFFTNWAWLFFLVSFSVLIFTIVLAVSNKSPYLIILEATIMMLFASLFGVGLANSDDMVIKTYGQVFIIMTSVMTGGLISTAIAEIRKSKLNKLKNSN